MKTTKRSQKLRSFSGREWAKLGFFIFTLCGSIAISLITPDLLTSLLISIVLFFVFAPLIDSLERKGMKRLYAIGILFITLSISLVVFMNWFVPLASVEIQSFEKGRFTSLNLLTTKLKAQEAGLVKYVPMFKDLNFSGKATQWLQQSGEKLIFVAPNIASHFFIYLLLVPFLTFVLLKDAGEIRRRLLRLVPNRYFETVYSVSYRIIEEIGGYIAARIIEALLVGLLVTTGCLIAQIPYATLLGAFAGATNPIPYLGPLLGGIPGVLFAFLDPAINNQLFWVILIYTIANAIDMLVLFPVIVAKSVNLHPVLVIIAVLLGSQFFGILGMIIAVPVTSILKILIQEIYSRIYQNSSFSQ